MKNRKIQILIEVEALDRPEKSSDADFAESVAQRIGSAAKLECGIKVTLVDYVAWEGSL